MVADGYSPPPRILLVGRRVVRKNKYVNIIGDFHLDLVVQHGAVPVIIPRTKGIIQHLEQFEPFHGLLVVEGEDVDPRTYGSDYSALSDKEREKVNAKFSDTVLDPVKDELEMALIRICLERGLPILSICRGSQLVNVASGGDLYLDLETQLGGDVVHYDPENYDGHRHPIYIDEKTPLYNWFGETELMVNSYHHCGVKTLAPRFRPMARTPDGLVEAFYDPSFYDPARGKFIVGLQFHPERMQSLEAHLADEEAVFDHQGCTAPYEAFITAAEAHAHRLAHEAKTVPWLANIAKVPVDKPAHWRAHFSVHGGMMALSLLQDGVDPHAQLDTEFIVPEDDVNIGDGKVVVDLPNPLSLGGLDQASLEAENGVHSRPLAV